jgi:prepilin-type N-terminal cleavage/methylation domain-containing protein
MRSAAMQGGFTLVEVMVAASLIILCLTGIYTMQAQGMMLLRQGRNAGATSQMLQQRVEQLRGSAYSTVTSSTGLASLMNGASATMPSELELVGVRNLTETITVFPYYRPSVTPPVTSQSFTITRINRVATGPGTATSLAAEPQVKAHLRVFWADREGNHQREFTTVLSSGGLSASGISTRP